MQQAEYLEVLARAPAELVKQFADDLIPQLGHIEVLQNRTGLVMLPMQDSAQGTTFYLGEVLIAEAHVRLASCEGYGACLGRDLEQALAIALLDAALATGIEYDRITRFLQARAAALAAADQELRQAAAATGVDLETF
jgi:alpha-D-ribose 1-methylphosphonate 5-triphosphate synthase subunit PhnG